MGNIAQWWSDSRGKVIATLLFLWLASVLFQFQPSHLINPIVAILGMVISDRILSRHVTLSSIVTGLLIGLVFDPTAGIIPVFAACLLASLSKNFIRSGPHNHVFNPAAFGIFIGSLLFQRPISWWGASWGMIPVFILAIGMAGVLWPFRRFWMPITFLGVYFLVTRSFLLLFDGTVFLFAFIMLPEPKTAPKVGMWQYGWGILVGGLVFLETVFKISFTDPLLLALLAANLVGYVFFRK